MKTSGPRQRRGIRTYIVGVFAIALSVYAVLGTYFATTDLKDARIRGFEDARIAARIAADSVEASIAETTTYMTGSDDWGPLLLSIGCSFSGNESGQSFSDVLDFSTLLIFDARGNVICSSAPQAMETPGMYRDVPWMQDGAATALTGVYADPLFNEDAFAFLMPTDLGNGERGLLASVMRTTTIAQRLAENFSAPEDTSFTILDASQNLVSSSMGQTLSGRRPPDAGSSQGLRWIDETDRLYASAEIPTFGWRIFAGVSEADAIAAAWTSIMHTFAVVIIGVVVAGFAAAYVYRKVVRPLRQLEGSISTAADVDSPSSVELDGPSEVVSVAEGFNRLVDSRAKLEDKLRRAAYEDDLTGLATRPMLVAELDEIFRRSSNARPGLFLVKLDRFDQARETFGHRVGDQVIIEAGLRLHAVATDGAIVARFAESSFAVLLPEVTSSEHLVRLCSVIVNSLSAPFEVNNGWIELTPRVGIAGRRPQGGTGDGMIEDALVALAEARRTGESYRFFDTSLRERADNDARIEQELGRAISRGELELHYQPIIHLDRREVIAAEALVRWRHPERGLLVPADFLAVAHRTGVMPRIDRYVAAQAIQQAATWYEEGRPLPISFNLSAAGIWEVETREAIEHALAFTGLPPKLMTVELTEGALIEESRVVRESLDRIRESGMSIAIDDFGTGFSSLAYLRRFPIDQLKIDRSFTQELDSSKGAALTGAIMGIADALRLRVVAEGVETEPQAEALRRLHCHRAQGFLFSKAVPADALQSVVPVLRTRSTPNDGVEVAATP